MCTFNEAKSRQRLTNSITMNIYNVSHWCIMCKRSGNKNSVFKRDERASEPNILLRKVLFCAVSIICRHFSRSETKTIFNGHIRSTDVSQCLWWKSCLLSHNLNLSNGCLQDCSLILQCFPNAGENCSSPRHRFDSHLKKSQLGQLGQLAQRNAAKIIETPVIEMFALRSGNAVPPPLLYGSDLFSSSLSPLP